MNVRTQKIINMVLIILCVVVIISLLIKATPTEEEKEKALEECKKNKDEECRAAKTSIFNLSMIVFVVLILVYLIKLYLTEEENILVEKEEATNYYLDWLETYRKLSFPRTNDGKRIFSEYFSEDTDTHYRMILSFKDEDSGKKKFAPIEIGKYYAKDKDGVQVIELGHGRGKITSDVRDAKIFETRHLNKPTEKITDIKVLRTIFNELWEQKIKEGKA
ncbi:MAG: hypothetical protein ACFFG0_06030 [Candidatus Thorarchaeota archaeon]